MKTFYVYIMGSKSGTLYVGMTSDIKKRVYEHKNHSMPGFTDKYNIDKLLVKKRWHLSTRLIPNGMILVKIGTTNGVSSW